MNDQTALEVRSPGVMVWRPEQSISGAWEALGDDWTLRGRDAGEFADRLEAKLDALALDALQRDLGDRYEIGHDSDGVWWAVRLDALAGPLQSTSDATLRAMLVADDAMKPVRRPA